MSKTLPRGKDDLYVWDGRRYVLATPYNIAIYLVRNWHTAKAQVDSHVEQMTRRGRRHQEQIQAEQIGTNNNQPPSLRGVVLEWVGHRLQAKGRELGRAS